MADTLKKGDGVLFRTVEGAKEKIRHTRENLRAANELVHMIGEGTWNLVLDLVADVHRVRASQTENYQNVSYISRAKFFEQFTAIEKRIDLSDKAIDLVLKQELFLLIEQALTARRYDEIGAFFKRLSDAWGTKANGLISALYDHTLDFGTGYLPRQSGNIQILLKEIGVL